MCIRDRLDSDLLDIFQACRAGTLDQLDIRWKDGAACCLVLASGGYPVAYQSGYPITGIDRAEQLDQVKVFHAGTALDAEGRLVTKGGRVLGVTAVAGDLEQAIDRAYLAAKEITFERMHFRTDIGRV